MIEERLSLRASDGKTIYYIRNKESDDTRRDCIIIGHGLTGHPNEYLHQQAKFYYTRQGYDVVRIAFYDSSSDARKLHECTVEIHAWDLNELIASLKPVYKRLFYIGHSYGGLTALLANPAVDGICFWTAPIGLISGTAWQLIFQSSIVTGSAGKVNALASKAMVEEAKALGHEEMKRKAQAMSSPACVILAGANQEGIEGREKLYDDLPGPKARFVIDNADHCFNYGATVFDLLNVTGNWISTQP